VGDDGAVTVRVDDAAVAPPRLVGELGARFEAGVGRVVDVAVEQRDGDDVGGSVLVISPAEGCGEPVPQRRGVGKARPRPRGGDLPALIRENGAASTLAEARERPVPEFEVGADRRCDPE
jgi:hypothetical protein